MTQYINKADVIAEIDKIYDEGYKFLPSDIVEDVQDFMDDILRSLDTLEVKEVELENEIDNQIRLLNGIHSMEDNHTFWKGTYNELTHFAKHFFELGLKMQKGE